MKTERELELEGTLRDAARELPEPNVLHERIERLLSDKAADGGEQCGLSHNELEESGLTQCQDCGANLSATPPPPRDALEALRIVDRHMSGNDSYEGIWVNYPDKPEQSPASVVREALTYEDAGGGEWCPSCGGQGCEDCRDTTRSVPEAVRRLPDRMRQIADMKHPLIYDIVVEWAEELDRALAQSGEGRVPVQEGPPPGPP